MKTLALAVAVLAISTFGALAQYTYIWSDNFDSYADQTALDAVYTQLYPAVPMMLDTTKSSSPAQSITGGQHANSERRMYLNLPGGPVAGSDANPLMVQFKVDTDAAGWWTREYIELRSYSGGAYGSGALQELYALGFTSSGVDTTLVNQRITFQGDTGWGNLTSTYATRASIAYPGNEFATTLAMVVKSSTIDYYVNGHLDSTKNIGSGILFDSLVIGSGLSTDIPVWFDDISVTVGIPEPSIFALGLVGGLGLLCVLRRRSA